MSIDDLYNNFKIVKQEVKRKVVSSLSSGSPNMAFLSSPVSTNEVDTASIQVSAVSTQVSTVSSHDNTANLSDATVGNRFEVAVSFTEHESKKNVLIVKRWDILQGNAEVLETKKAGQGIKTAQEKLNVEDTSSKSMVVINGSGFDWSYMADDEVPTNMDLMAFSDSEKLKKENESNWIEIDNFENASKSLDKLIGNQITDNSRTELGFTSYNAVAPPPTGLFTHSTIDLSNSSLEEFQHPEFKGYGPKDSQSVCVDTSNEIKKVPDALIIED
nr:hypothetical protein [Tanacetum cinerariifolium]